MVLARDFILTVVKKDSVVSVVSEEKQPNERNSLVRDFLLTVVKVEQRSERS